MAELISIMPLSVCSQGKEVKHTILPASSLSAALLTLQQSITRALGIPLGPGPTHQRGILIIAEVDIADGRGSLDLDLDLNLHLFIKIDGKGASGSTSDGGHAEGLKSRDGPRININGAIRHRSRRSIDDRRRRSGRDIRLLVGWWDGAVDGHDGWIALRGER
jgi:hypothetical protein